LKWTQLSDPEGTQHGVAYQYNVQGIPASFLISPEGKIISKGLDGKETIKKLDGLFTEPMK